MITQGKKLKPILHEHERSSTVDELLNTIGLSTITLSPLYSPDILLSKKKLLRQQGKYNEERRADPLNQHKIDLTFFIPVIFQVDVR